MPALFYDFVPIRFIGQHGQVLASHDTHDGHCTYSMQTACNYDRLCSTGTFIVLGTAIRKNDVLVIFRS